MSRADGNRRRLGAACLLVPALAAFAACAHARRGEGGDYRVTVLAGEFERRGTPVSFPLPPEIPAGGLFLADPSGRRIPLQARAGQGTFVLDSLAAGSTREYRLERGAMEPPRATATHAEGRVSIDLGGAPVLRYNVAKTARPRPDVDPVYERAGYLHPVFSPSGKVVTGDYPRGSEHQHGIWAAWRKALFEGRETEFWGVGNGGVELVSLDSVWSGPVEAGLRARHRYVDRTVTPAKDALHESWTIRVYHIPHAGASYRLFDLELLQTPASSSPVILQEYLYGGVGFRGPEEWFGEENAIVLTSEGRRRADGNATRARWMHAGGRVQGTLTGVGILAHPTNFRFPEPVRIHPQGPFFNWSPSQAGDWSIEPGRPYRARYRFVVHDGEAAPEQLERLWNDFADPPRVHLSER